MGLSGMVNSIGSFSRRRHFLCAILFANSDLDRGFSGNKPKTICSVDSGLHSGPTLNMPSFPFSDLPLDGPFWQKEGWESGHNAVFVRFKLGFREAAGLHDHRDFGYPAYLPLNEI